MLLTYYRAETKTAIDIIDGCFLFGSLFAPFLSRASKYYANEV